MTTEPLSTLDLKVLWRNVSTARGTRMPASTGLDAFLSGMAPIPRQRHQDALSVCRKGTDLKNELDLVAWASACTHSLIKSKASEAGIAATPEVLFEAGLSLLDDGVDPGSVLMRPELFPEQMKTLRHLAGVTKVSGVVEAGQRDKAITSNRTDFQVTASIPSNELGHDEFDDHMAATAMAVQTGRPRGDEIDTSQPQQARDGKRWASVRLFGNTAAHTFEIQEHRRAGNFLGVSVIGIESARALPQGGYDWDSKLTIQLTPEEMPDVIAVLLGIQKDLTFSNHGSDRNKAVTFRNQDGGLHVVTSRRGDTYPVPVKTAVMYYLLDLFCRAMAEGRPDRTPTDVIALVRGIYS